MKNILLAAFAIFFSLNLFAQTPNWLWAESIGGVSYDDVGDIATDAYGNVYVTGGFSGNVGWTITIGGTVLTGAGGSDIFIAKYDSSGNVIWAKSAGGTGGEWGSGITTDAMGNVLVTGDFSGSSLTFGSTTLPSPGTNTTCFIAKYDSSGNVIWATSSVGSASIAVSTSISADASDNVLITGWFNGGSVDFGSVLVHNAGWPSDLVFVMKFDSAGNDLWANKSIGGGYHYGTGVTADPWGNVYATGYFGSPWITFNGVTLTSLGDNDIYVVKYDSAGGIIWARNAGGANLDQGQSIKTDLSGNVYVTGSLPSGTSIFGGIILYNPDSATSGNLFVAKYDSSGNVSWATNGGGAGNVRGTDISTDDIGNSYVTGHFTSTSLRIGNATVSNNGMSDVFIASFDTSGNATGLRSLGGSGYELESRISINTNGNVFVSGIFRSISLGIGNDTLTNAGYDDVFITKLEQVCVPTTSTLNPVSCNSFTSPSGISTWTTSGVFSDTISNTFGCDSIITINLTIHTVDTSIIQNGVSLTSNAIAATYQWLDCNNGFAQIAGETDSVFTASSNGNYALALTQNGCTDTSSCYMITNVGIEENRYLNNSLKIFSNPTNGQFIISSPVTIDDLKIMNLIGQVINQYHPKEKMVSVELTDAGVYFVQATTGGITITRKIMVAR